jgi:hypothetical protein
MTLSLVSERPTRNTAPFSDAENVTLRTMCAEGASYSAMSAALGRSPSAIARHVAALDIDKPAAHGGWNAMARERQASAPRVACHRCGVLLARAPAAGRGDICGWCEMEKPQ